jgi:SAM-dependent methyltransferase
LRDIFGTQQIVVEHDAITVNGRKYPVINDVIVATSVEQYTPFVRQQINTQLSASGQKAAAYAPDIQFTFGEEWKIYNTLLPEHIQEFDRYFDLVDIEGLKNARVGDLGCGMGRWSYFLKDRVRELVLVDFSDAIFVARKNLADAANGIFIMADLQRLPLKDDFADFIFSLGVLHHLPTPCLDEVRRLKRFAPRLLVFLYYALDNRPVYFRVLLQLVTLVRRMVCGINNAAFRRLFARAGVYFIYLPLIVLGKAVRPLKLSRYVPLYEFYHDKTVRRIEQDVYDRFFTRIEQRVTRREIMLLRDTFSNVTISSAIPYWHFVCTR